MFSASSTRWKEKVSSPDPQLTTSSTLVLLLGGECKPLVPPQSPLPEGTGRQAGSAWNPQDEKRESGWGAPTPHPPRTSPHASISRRTWC